MDKEPCKQPDTTGLPFYTEVVSTETHELEHSTFTRQRIAWLAHKWSRAFAEKQPVLRVIIN